ncbi:hypothetical protein [Marisediminicola sp. LYQ134]|uniref:hypothetical protein n=1 Tax=Marisediminicola sp. LYQ134 TaxID=3391061 RepID=UPI003982E633
MSAATKGTAHGERPSGGRRLAKRVIEAFLVALPALLVVLGTISGSLGSTLGSWLSVAAVVVMAAGVATEHWVAYVVILVVGIIALFSTGLLALAAWVVGAIYIGIAVINLVIIVRRRRSS